MRILVVATKSPWPPRDGGRLALWLTMQGLAQSGHALALVAPADGPGSAPTALERLREVCEPHLVAAHPRPWPAASLDALLHRRPLTVARHRHPAAAIAVAECVQRWRPDCVHVEQLQAWWASAPARSAGIPVLLRMQNVESDLWARSAAGRALSLPMRVEAARLRRGERTAMAQAARVLALTTEDGQRLRRIGGAGVDQRIHVLPPPFPADLPSAAPRAGNPAVVLAGSGGWRPNHDATRWFVDGVVPLLHARAPTALVHVHGMQVAQSATVRAHAAPEDSLDAFPAGAIAAVPLFVGSGIRMRILEAWARGLPVVATSTAARGLQASEGEQLLLADDAATFASAIVQLHEDPHLRARLIQGGRQYLRRHHDPAAHAQALLEHYRRCGAGER